ncbi:MAG: hypothetical protein H6855_05125 [Rhodospirillales bacterium]|nr:hypothetical protein [Rhodospirillales bacterium]MCB9973021.1 hypothetical protein [Rhodospirillales bacterium]
MTSNYAELRIRDALKAARGNQLKARKQIEKWCQEDMKLLLALTKPHMTGIVAHALDRVVNKMARGEPLPPERPVQEPVQAQGIDFGKELLKNFAMGKPAKFAQESFSPPIKRKKASQSHIDAIHKLAKKKK